MSFSGIPRLQASPDFKGIKTLIGAVFGAVHGFKPALISKGLRLDALAQLHLHMALQASPDFKGIKTGAAVCFLSNSSLQASPDFKGIKTPTRLACFSPGFGFKPALISKGLRRVSRSNSGSYKCFKPALISKGLRPSLGFMSAKSS